MNANTSSNNDTITAIATAPGRGGIGVVRVSGPKTKAIVEQIVGCVPEVRSAHFAPFVDAKGQTIDEGIALYFESPNSFTGEDVLELQGHGGPVVLDRVVQRAIELGARLARPGEFSERAFLNNKIDLTQAEAIADLIDAESEQAARSAMRSLQGEFSNLINELVQAVIKLRMFVEAAIDFPEEEIDFIADSTVVADANHILQQLEQLLAAANQGVLLKEGITVVIAGPPNAGKSSLLNALSGRESAIVTDVPGTTRDVLREQINLNGVPLHIIDTAGLRQSDDVVEQEGIKRAHGELAKADVALLVFDIQKVAGKNIKQLIADTLPSLDKNIPTVVVMNKIDLSDDQPKRVTDSEVTQLFLSVKTQDGLNELTDYLLELVGYHSGAQGNFIARRRHLACLEKAKAEITHGLAQLEAYNAGELLAEDLRQAQQALNEITGEFTPDDLLGEIFSHFCIGK